MLSYIAPPLQQHGCLYIYYLKFGDTCYDSYLVYYRWIDTNHLTILPNGSVMKIDLLKSSGSVVLDQSAMRIVRMAAPYQPFPDELRKQIDRLEIIRTWRFEKGDIFSSDRE